MVFEYCEGETFLHKLDPRVKILLYFVFTFLAIAYSDPTILFLIYLAVLAMLKTTKISLKKLSPMYKAILPLLLIYPLFNLLGYRGQFGENYLLGHFLLWDIYLEALIYSLGVEFKVLIIMTTLTTILYVTPLNQLLTSLTKLKFPAEFAVALSIGFSYIPVLMDEIREIVNAQELKGVSHNTKNPVKLLFSYIPLIMPSLMNAFRRAQEIALTIETKGFSRNPKKRTFITEMKYRKTDWLFTLSLFLLLCFALITGQWYLNLGNFNFTLYLMRKIF